MSLEILPHDMIFEIYKWLKITDKRHFNINKHYYHITRKQFKIDEEMFTAFETTSDKIQISRHYCADKFFIELCHDQYFHLIPGEYLNINSEFYTPALAYYGGFEISKMPSNYNFDNFCYYAAENGQIEALKWVNNKCVPKDL